MNKSIGLLVCASLISLASSAWAQTVYVPRYFAYQMNGIYYFYCTHDGCGGGTASMQAAPRMHVLGCEGTVALDPISGTPVYEGDVREKEEQKLRLAFNLLGGESDPSPAGRLPKHALAKKGPKGMRYQNPANRRKIVMGGTVSRATKDDVVERDREFRLVDGNGETRYFRVISVRSAQTLPAMYENPSFFAQEIAKPQDLTAPLVDSFDFGGGTVGEITVDLPSETGGISPAPDKRILGVLAAEDVPNP